MATVNYTLRLDELDKSAAEQVFRTLGMSFATGVNIYIKKVGREQRIPFSMDLRETDAPKSLKEAFEALQNASLDNGTDKMSLDEINAEITSARKEKRANA